MARHEAPKPVDRYRPTDSLITCMIGEGIQSVIDFPRCVEGLTILDVASGGSDNLAKLRRKGASVIGVDIAYRDLKRFEEKVAYGMIDPYWWSKGRSVPNLATEQVNHILADSVKDSIMIQLSKESFQNFMRDVNSNGGYVAARAEELPLADETVDIAYSTYGLTSVLISDYDALKKAVLEIVRVLKPGGNLQLWPWINPQNPSLWTDNQLKNINAFIEFLNASQLTVAEESLRNDDSTTRLRIVKPS